MIRCCEPYERTRQKLHRGWNISADIGARAADRLRVQSQTGLRSLGDRIGRHPSLVHARLLPKPASHFDEIDAGGLPPGAFVACAIGGPVMHAAERDREFIARFAAEGMWFSLRELRSDSPHIDLAGRAGNLLKVVVQLHLEPHGGAPAKGL